MGAKRGKRPQAADARPLTAEHVVQAALVVLDEVGLAGFTMRAVAERLGTYPATVYWHVGNRAELLSAVVDLSLAEVAAADPAAMRWDDWLRVMAGNYRRVIHRHPNVGALVASQLTVSIPAVALVESVLAVLHSAGFRDRALANAFNGIVGSLVGWVAVELSADPAEDDRSWQERYEAVISTLPEEQYPTIASNRGTLADAIISLRWHGGRDKPMDESFEASLEMWIRGLEWQLHGSPD